MDLGVVFRTVIEAAPDAMVVANKHGAIVVVNSQAERVFGYRAGELVGRPVEVLVPEPVRLAHARHRAGYWDNSATRPMGAGLELEGCRRDGTTFPAEISLSSIETDDGRLVLAAVRDVTERRVAETKFRGLLEAAPDAMVMVDATGAIVMANRQSEELFGYRRDELIGRQVELLIPEDVRDRHPAQRDGYFAHPTTRPMGGGRELEGRRRDGSTFPAEISLSWLPGEDGILVSAAIRDVTARKAAESETQAAREEAERANRAKSEFLSRMSHELRTPLNSILGFAQLLRLEGVTPEQEESVQFIEKGGTHLLSLINEVLDISRIEAGELRISLVPVPLVETVGEVIALLTPSALERQVLIRTDPDAPAELVVSADQGRLKQVVLNLVSNAVKYNRPGGEVRVSWSVEGARAVLSVEDTGVGIPAELVDRLFLPFERLGKGTEVEGTGLGLSLSLGLVKAMNGTMSVDSELGRGSTFRVELDRPADAAAPTGAPAVAGTPRHRVLYVEDNLSNLRLVERSLARRDDIELLPTLQGSMALELARKHQPELILLDLHLPDVHGSDVFDSLAEDPATSSIPIIIVSADATPDQVQALLDRGAFAYMTKPLDVSRFRELVDLALTPEADRWPPSDPGELLEGGSA